jgi:hypothetical protein
VPALVIVRRRSTGDSFAYATSAFSSVGVYQGPARRLTAKDGLELTAAKRTFLSAAEADAKTRPTAAASPTPADQAWDEFVRGHLDPGDRSRSALIARL